MKDKVLQLDLETDLSFEDFCNKKYISQIAEEELQKFTKQFFLHGHNYANLIEVSKREFNSSGKIEVSEKYLDSELILFYVNNVSHGNQYYLPNVDITFCDECYPQTIYDGESCPPFVYINDEHVHRTLYTYSDFTMQRPSFLFSVWNWEPSFFMFMYKKFGEEYSNDFLEQRKMYRAYWLAKETAKRDDAIRLMKENVPIHEIKKLTKTTESFASSIPIDIVKLFYERQVRGEPWVVDVTNFQTLKNEDIPEENKDWLKRTRLRRIKYSTNDAGLIESVEEYQWREPKQVWNGNGYDYYYTKKNHPVHSRKCLFRDFDIALDGNIYRNHLDNYKNFSVWNGIMYAAFGEEYGKAYQKTFDDKITEYLNSFDAETIKIMAFINHYCNKNPRLASNSININVKNNLHNTKN